MVSRLRTEPFAEEDLSHDAFLGGRLRMAQPKTGYRAGVDPVLLAASVPARAGQSLLDLGCGSGIAALCVASRVPGVTLAGLEIQAAYAALARQNSASNGIALEVFEGDIADMPASLRKRQFDHIIANPPYFERDRSTPASDTGREKAMGEALPLADWVHAAARRTGVGGTVTFIQRVERLPDLLAAMATHLGSIEILPLIPRRGRAARLILLRGRKGGRAALRLHDGWLLHAGENHGQDGADYTTATSDVLRNAAALPFPD
ncbi:tRNA1(Val) (adenine(37)-N6)-methyltransferase [Roseovarius mucosus]|uniref:tRNA1(Val) (Adenine(37)-N6)-methyltransferase n=1 Tax=Roseovarius mucosus TaxID=215743 RepID=A0A1V0RNY4_9RHOB|nr:tRNA1(Val) (adenine(37)-N6)-methyltransferase [Roseovarius mucosus]